MRRLSEEWQRWRDAIGSPAATPVLWSLVAVLGAWVPIAAVWYFFGR